MAKRFSIAFGCVALLCSLSQPALAQTTATGCESLPPEVQEVLRRSLAYDDVCALLQGGGPFVSCESFPPGVQEVLRKLLAYEDICAQLEEGPPDELVEVGEDGALTCVGDGTLCVYPDGSVCIYADNPPVCINPNDVLAPVVDVAESVIQPLEEEAGAGAVAPIAAAAGCVGPPGTPFVTTPSVDPGSCTNQGVNTAEPGSCWVQADRPHPGKSYSTRGLVVGVSRTWCQEYWPPSMSNYGWLIEDTPSGGARVVDNGPGGEMHQWPGKNRSLSNRVLTETCPGQTIDYATVSYGRVTYEGGYTGEESSYYEHPVTC